MSRRHRWALGPWALLALSVAAGCRAAPATGPAVALPPENEVWLNPNEMAAARLVIQSVQVTQLPAPVLCAGRLSFDDQRVARIFAPVSGRITQIFAPEGSHVDAQGPLCEIRSVDLAQAVAADSEAQADLTTAKRALERQRTLFEGHAAAQKDYEAARTAYVQAQAEYERAHQKRRLLGGLGATARDRYVLRSPLAGTVVASGAHPGAEVQGQYSAGQDPEALFVVGDLDSIWAMADVFEMDIRQIDVGDAAEVESIAYPGKKFLATVDWVADTLDPATRAMRVRCRLLNADHRLQPNMAVRVRILSDKPAQLTVPRTGLFRQGAKTVAFVAAQREAPGGRMRFERREVQAQMDAYGEQVPIVAGIEPGERVVTSGGIMLLGDG